MADDTESSWELETNNESNSESGSPVLEASGTTKKYHKARNERLRTQEGQEESLRNVLRQQSKNQSQRNAFSSRSKSRSRSHSRSH